MNLASKIQNTLFLIILFTVSCSKINNKDAKKKGFISDIILKKYSNTDKNKKHFFPYKVGIYSYGPKRKEFLSYYTNIIQRTPSQQSINLFDDHTNGKISQIGCAAFSILYNNIISGESVTIDEMRNHFLNYINLEEKMSYDSKIGGYKKIIKTKKSKDFMTEKYFLKFLKSMKFSVSKNPINGSLTAKDKVALESIYPNIDINKDNEHILFQLFKAFTNYNGKGPIYITKHYYQDYAYKIFNTKHFHETLCAYLEEYGSFVLNTNGLDHYIVVLEADLMFNRYTILDTDKKIKKISFKDLKKKSIMRSKFTKKSIDALVGNDKFAKLLFCNTKKLLKLLLENYVEENDESFIRLANKFTMMQFRHKEEEGDHILLYKLKKNK